MKGKNVNGEASSGSSSERNGKNKKCEIDRISNLPDSVLAHILSFLPTQDAVKTLLLRRFGLLWATTDNLHFDACSFHDREELHYYYAENDRPSYKRFINFVGHVLALHERNPIHRFHLKFEFFMHYSVDGFYLQNPGYQELIKREMMLAEEINTWTLFAIRREVKVLDLDFLACRRDIDESETLYKVPEFVFNCDSIRELKLVYCKVEPQGQIQMRSIRTLFLKRVTLDGTKIDEILSGFPLLENLSLIECYNLLKLNFVPPNLKYLKVVGICYDSRLEICGPNITSLDVSGSVGQVGLKNLCSLKDATLGINYCFCWGEDQYQEVRKILENLNHATVLTIYEEHILFWFIWASINISFAPTAWKHIIVSTKVTNRYLPGVASMLRTSPCLEMLDIHIESPITYLVGDFGFFAREFDVENYWSKLEESSQGLTNNLRTVRIYGWFTEYDVLQLVQFLLKNSMGLEKMVITTKRRKDSNQESYLSSDKLQELSQKLLSFPRASTSVVILVS